MSTANTTPHTSVQQFIEQRLDAIDQALLGLLPRQDRLAAVAHIETQIREIVAARPAVAANLHAATQSPALGDSAFSDMMSETPAFLPHPQFFRPASGGWVPATQKKRSRLAIAAGVVGMIALALLFATPVTYFFVVEMLSEVLGELVAISLMGAHAVAMWIGGLAAVGLGIGALVSLRRRKHLAGHGWAIAGLCTGPLPMLLGCAAVVMLGAQLGVEQISTTSESQVASDADSAMACESADDIGPVAMRVSPMETDDPDSESNQPSVQPAGHEARAATTRMHALGTSGAVPTPTDCPPSATQPEPAPQPEPPLPSDPQSAPGLEPAGE